MNKFLKRMAAVTLSAALIIPAYANAAPTCSGAYTIDAYAKNTAKLSKKNLKMTDAGKKYTIKLTTSAKKPQINWSSTIKAGTAEGAEPCISMKVSSNKKKVTVTPLRNGQGTIVCSIGKKKLKCSYTVKFPEQITSHFSELADYLEINGYNSGGVRVKEFGDFNVSDAKCTVYGYYEGRDSIRFDVGGTYDNTSDYFNVTFHVLSNGQVNDVSVRERVGSQDIYQASITLRAASAFSKGCKNIDFYTTLEPGASQSLDSCSSLAKKNFDVVLRSVDQCLRTNFGYGVQNIGFVNYK